MMGAKGLQYMVLDSYEAGHMTWTRIYSQVRVLNAEVMIFMYGCLF